MCFEIQQYSGSVRKKSTVNWGTTSAFAWHFFLIQGKVLLLSDIQFDGTDILVGESSILYAHNQGKQGKQCLFSEI